MNVLAIESSGPIGSAAACCDGEVLAEDILEHGMAHGRLLVPLLDKVVQEAGWDKRRDIDLVAVDVGPGSFTGLRVGVMCAKTLAASLERPMIGVCSLDAMAENAPEECDRILTVLDAKRGEVYAAAYERGARGLERIRGPEVSQPAAAGQWLPVPFFVMGDGLRRHADVLCRAGAIAAAEALWRVRAGVVARLGLAAYRGGGGEDVFGLQPTYLRLPEAEEKRLSRGAS